MQTGREKPAARMVITTGKRKLIVWGMMTVLLPLIIGATLYYIYCPEVWFVQKVDYLFGIEHVRIAHKSGGIYRLIRNYFFDFIWGYTLANATYIIFNNNAKPMIVCLAIPTLLGTTMELLQLFNLAQGTFDVWDIAAEILGASLGAFIIHFYLRRKYP